MEKTSATCETLEYRVPNTVTTRIPYLDPKNAWVAQSIQEKIQGIININETPGNVLYSLLIRLEGRVRNTERYAKTEAPGNPSIDEQYASVLEFLEHFKRILEREENKDCLIKTPEGTEKAMNVLDIVN